MAKRKRAPAPKTRVRKATRKRPRGFDSNRARKVGRKIPKQEIPSPRGRPYVPINRTYTPELLANGRRRYEETAEEVSAIAADFRIHPGSLRRLAGELGWVRFGMQARGLPAASRLLAQAEEVEASAAEQTAEARADLLDRLEREVRAHLALVTAARERLQGLPPRPREGEASARTLTSLTAVLQKIHLMRCGLNPSDTHDDDIPADIDAFRDEIARRIEAFVASRREPDDADGASGSGAVA
jgi:hypothetical protein